MQLLPVGNILGKSALTIGLMAILFISCKKSSDEPQFPSSNIMLLNLATDLTPINANIAGAALVNGGFAYQTYSQGYSGVNAGGQTTILSNLKGDTTIFNQTVPYLGERYMSMFLAGASGKYVFISAVDDFSLLQGKSDTTALLRYAYLVTDTVSTATVSINTISDATLNYRQIGSFKTIKPGQITIDVKKADSTAAIIAPSRTITLTAGNAYTIVIAGKPNSTIPAQLPKVSYISVPIPGGIPPKSPGKSGPLQ